MEKDKTIIQLIGRLKLVISFTLLEIVDYWEMDLCAIGLKKENRLVYISTFNYIQNKKIMYDFDLEIIEDNNSEKFNVVKIVRNVSENELVKEIKLFLDL